MLFHLTVKESGSVQTGFAPAPCVVKTNPEVEGAKAEIVPAALKYRVLPWAVAEKSWPVPPLLVAS